MPCQVSWQSVELKSQPSVHGLDAEAEVAEGGLTGTVSAAQLVSPQKAPPAAVSTTANNAVRCIVSVPGSMPRIEAAAKLVGKKIRAQYRRRRKNLDPRGSHATQDFKGSRFPCCYW